MSEPIIIASITAVSVVLGAIVTGLTNVWAVKLQKQAQNGSNQQNTRWPFALGRIIGLITGLISATLLVNLVVAPGSVIPSGDTQAFYDFETSSDLENWSKDLQVEQADIAFTGNYGLKATIPVSITSQGGFGLRLNKDFTADLIIGRMLIPEIDTVSIDYAQICLITEKKAWPCERLPKETGVWKTFAVKLSHTGNTKDQTPADYSNERFNGFVVILNTRGLVPNYPKQMDIYLDTIEIR